MSSLKSGSWDKIIQPKKSLLSLDFKSLWNYKDLLLLFVRRDFVSLYKQTILGPIWFFIQPLLTTITFTVIFGRVAKVPTDGVPQFLFYMAGVTLWSYFADCLVKTSDTFISNRQIFSKVYFPRYIVPLSIVITNLFKFGIQLLLLVAFIIYYYIIGAEIQIGLTLLIFPFLALVIALLGLGFGTLISAMTTKYRDLRFLIQFGVQLLMYITPVVYPLSIVSEKYKTLVLLNPMTSIIELFKYSIFGKGYVNVFWLSYSLLFAVALFLFSKLMFNRVEKSFIDTV